MPSEQANGKLKFSSDVYAIGIITIQALTGKYPLQLHDADTEEILKIRPQHLKKSFPLFSLIYVTKLKQ